MFDGSVATPLPIQVHVYQARHLVAADDNGASDPYVRVSYMGETRVSSVVQRSLNPCWWVVVFHSLRVEGVSAATL